MKAAREERRSVYTGGERLEPRTASSWLRPSSTASTDVMAIAREEVFGPVVVASDLRNRWKKAIAHRQFDTSYGLSAGVWSRDIDTCMAVGRGVRAGTVWVNTFMDGYARTAFRRLPAVRHRTRTRAQRAVKDYTEEKTFHVHRGPRTSWWLPRARRT